MHHVIVMIEMLFFFGGIVAFGLWQIHSINKRQKARAAGTLVEKPRGNRREVKIPRESLGVFGSTYEERQSRAVDLSARREIRESQLAARRRARETMLATGRG